MIIYKLNKLPENVKDYIVDYYKKFDLQLQKQVVVSTNARMKNVDGCGGYNRRKEVHYIDFNPLLLSVLFHRRSFDALNEILAHEMSHCIDHMRRGITNHDNCFLNIMDEIFGLTYNGKRADIPRKTLEYYWRQRGYR